MVRCVQEKLGVSERLACRVVGQPRSSQRYVAQQRNGEEALKEKMKELALRWPRYGYRLVWSLLRREGFRVNVKRVHRLWKKEGLKVPRKQRKRKRLCVGGSENGIVRYRPLRMNHVWSFDFCEDRTADGKRVRILSVIDEFTRRCLAIRAERSMGGVEVVSVLKALVKMYGVPEHVRCDNGTEFVCKALQRWLKREKVSALYIAPGSPWENGYTESYHSRLRDELLKREEFGSLEEARVLLGEWRREYNEERPHGSLGYATPAEFARECCVAEPCSAALRSARQEEEEVKVFVAQ